jgi:hypothetical protein
MSTEESGTVAHTPSSQLSVLANALPDDKKINLTKFDDSQRQRITDIASTVGVLVSPRGSNATDIAERSVGE